MFGVRMLCHLLSRNTARRWQSACITAVVFSVLLGTTGRLLAQRPSVRFLHTRDLSPGAIGRERLKRGGPVHGYFQPIEIHAPKGALISFAIGGRFDKPRETPIVAGMLISPVYRLRVTNIPIPFKEGMEVYPTIEVIDRTYPPKVISIAFMASCNFCSSSESE